MNHNYSNFKTSDETYESDSGDEYVDVYETIPRNLTALHVAARNNHTGAITKLVSLGAHVDARTSWGTTPLMTAAYRGCTKVRNRRVFVYMCMYVCLYLHVCV